MVIGGKRRKVGLGFHAARLAGELKPDHAQEGDSVARFSAWDVPAHSPAASAGYAGMMPTDATSKDREITIRDLYPHLADAELREAEENMERYLELELRMYERIFADSEAYARFKALTVSSSGRTVPDKGRAFLNNLTLHSKE